MRLQLAWYVLSPVLLVLIANPALANASAISSDITVALRNSDYTFVDSQRMTNVVGIVDNHGTTPISVTMALNVAYGDGKTSTIFEGLYGSVIYPGKGAPFKFRLEEGTQAVGKPYIAIVRKVVDQPLYKTLVLNYTNMAVGQERVLMGTMKNTGTTELRNIVVYASVHDENTTDIDSVKSNIVPMLKPGEVATFMASPDPSVKAKVYYYSCAGFDINAPISTLSTGDGGFIAYDFSSIAKVSSMRYDNTTDSITFGIKHYNPNGGSASLRIPQFAQNQTLAVMMDGKLYDGATVKGDGKTFFIDFFVPPGEHNVQIQGVRAVPEFPFVPLILAGLISSMIAVARFKAAFKIS
jgi:hypothetical protein